MDYSWYHNFHNIKGPVVHSVERLICNEKVGGSNPPGSTISYLLCLVIDSLIRNPIHNHPVTLNAYREKILWQSSEDYAACIPTCWNESN